MKKIQIMNNMFYVYYCCMIPFLLILDQMMQGEYENSINMTYFSLISGLWYAFFCYLCYMSNTKTPSKYLTMDYDKIDNNKIDNNKTNNEKKQ